jgi:hypothetical protein
MPLLGVCFARVNIDQLGRDFLKPSLTTRIVAKITKQVSMTVSRKKNKNHTGLFAK